MIATRLIGGLGNQMFQYAYGFSLARRRSEKLVLDVSAFESYDLHVLAIDQFNISAARMTQAEFARIPGRYRGKSRWAERIANFAGGLQSRDKRPLRLRREKPFGFAEKYLAEGSDLYLDGYWQSERYFPGLQTELKKEFQLKRGLSDESSRVLDEIQSSMSVAMHVRRGDYVTNAETLRIYRELDAGYYRKCLNDLRQRFSNLNVFVFSNDIQWCQDHLDVGLKQRPVTHNDATTAFEDMYLMSQCDHSIIANSSFSWWAAFLGRSDAQRRVYYPDPWFNPGTLNGDSLGCANWVSESSISVSRPSRAA